MRLHALNINIPIRIHPFVSRHSLAPILHVLEHRLLQLLLAEIQRLLVFANHADLGPRRYVHDTKVVLVKTLLDGALHLAGKDISAQPRFLAHRAGESDAIDGFQRRDHGADGLKTAGNIGLNFTKGGDDSFRKLEEKRLALLRALAFVRKRQLFISPAAELDEVKVVGLELRAQGFALFGVEALVLELDAVDFDAEDEGFRDALLDLVCDFHGQAGAVLEGAAVLVRAFVCGLREELGEEVAVGTVELDAVVAGFVEVFGSVGEAVDDAMDFFGGGRVRFREGHAHDVAFELDIAGGDGVAADVGGDLAAGVADLADHEAAVFLALGGHGLKGLKAFAFEFGAAGDDGVSLGFELVVVYHDVSGQDSAKLALAPALVDIDQVLRRYAAGLEVFGVP